MHIDKPVTVADLVAHLQTLPQDLYVVEPSYSEYLLLDRTYLPRVVHLQEARPDGWAHDPRPDKPLVRYVAL